MFLLAMRSLWFAIVTWMQLFGAVVSWHTNMCWCFILWTVSITTFPIRAWCALRREKMMERVLQQLQVDLENLSWDYDKLAAHLKLAIEEHHLMESMLAELETEHDKAINKIEFLEEKVEHLKNENLSLKEIETKGIWDTTHRTKTEDRQTTSIGKNNGHDESSKSGDDNLLDDLLLQKRSWSSNKHRRSATNPAGLLDPLTPLIFSGDINTDAALDHRREAALSQTLFSALLSLLVGATIWEAKDPCMPLVMALFAVVGLSLRSVVQFFSTIKNRPASDAVALLSCNWFILGTLSVPAFPKVARMLAPVVATFLQGTLGLESL
ncbi:uncharacterized protein LOC130804222 isoform X2 [Amaranthus tricolor]|nr:uncharacterized protein LOC130804222 isoform X2 [Amaranthus tricolor]XP_057524576.1 uncharacterized protein LOC130804222 isoform X2 [Amaranthus tricolor]XP_057524577.1 uncharacterized protein LOC130804222 isoform X2 [Amaranthus tricolor]XP_057524578.1 uncharacterized protein LOC130804222 isoform X2 [Amaranthus tricolor]